MAYAPYILPWITLLLAVAAVAAQKFLEFRSVKWIAAMATVGVLFLVCNVFIVISTLGLNSHLAQAEQKLATEEERRYRFMDELSMRLAQIPPLSQNQSLILDQIKNFGWVPLQPAMRALVDANEARERLLAGYYPRGENLFKGLPKLSDHTLLELSLRQISFTNVPYRTDEPVPDVINVIYFGKMLDIRDVKLVALTLMRAGVELKAIKPFPKDTQGNLTAIKAEYSKTLDVRRNLTAADVERATVFN